MKRPYIVCAGQYGRAVIFGWAETEPIPGQPYRLHRARMILRFARTGLHGHAARGPVEGTRMTSAVTVDAGEAVRQVLHVSASAAAALDAWPAWEG